MSCWMVEIADVTVTVVCLRYREHMERGTAGQFGSLGEVLSDQLTRRCCIDRLCNQVLLTYADLFAWHAVALSGTGLNNIPASTVFRDFE
jgi:hypothetical protein